MTRALSTATPRRAAGSFATLAQRGWRASWDAATGVPAWLWGGRVRVPDGVTDAAAAERGARAFLDAQLALLAPGAAPSDFTLLANHLDARSIRTVTFAQTWRGLRVHRGAVGLVIAGDRIVAVRSAALPDVTVQMPGPIDVAAQRWRVEAALGEPVHPSGEREVVVLADGSYRVADVYENDGWRVHADARGEIVARRRLSRFATGTLEYSAGIRWGGGARATFPASHAAILVNSVATTTTAEGGFVWTGTAPSTVITSVAGTYVRVINSAGASAMQTFDVDPGATQVWDMSASEFDDAQLSAYIYGNQAKARARVINPAVVAWLDEQTAFHVNDTGTCNAQAVGGTVRLFRASAQCANTALVGDIVFHEFGHLLHDESVIPGMGDYESHLSEGLSDFFASNLTNDPAMGRGFFKSDEPLRQIDPPGYERIYPADFDFDPHVSGLIIAGALWDLRKTLVAQLGAADGVARTEQIFTGIMQRADDISTTYTAALIADDDDADLGNGTPNECAITTAFGRHGLVPGYPMTTVAPPVITGRQLAVRVTMPPASACPPPAVASIQVTWRAGDGAASTLALVSTGTEWVGEFPEQPDNTLITYSVDITFDDGSLQSYPNNPADPLYQLFLGESTPLWCEHFDTEPGWEETSNLGREWEWGMLGVASNTPDPVAPFTGTMAFGTDIAGDGYYRANLTTTITTPVIAIPTFETVRLQYWRWLTVEDGAYDIATIEANGTELWRNASAQNGTLDHIDREWRYHDIDITPWITGGTLQLSWTLASDFGKEFGGWTIDDVCVVGLAKIPTCGDGELDVGEQCDDGNRASGDGCSDACIDEITGGGGGCCSSSGGGGSIVLALGLFGWMRRLRRRY